MKRRTSIAVGSILIAIGFIGGLVIGYLLAPVPTGQPDSLEASFTMSVDSGTAPLTVQFQDTSTGGAISWLWNFGDGNTSTAKNPQHGFNQEGRYFVQLTVSGASGSESASEMVNVHIPRLDVLGSDMHGSALAAGDINSLFVLTRDIVAVSRSSGNITWWPTNAGSGTLGNCVTIDSTFNGACALALGNIDNDLFTDVVVASSSGNSIVWYKNDGNGTFGIRRTVTSILDGACAVAIADFDSDGYKDIAAAGQDADLLLWFKNNGSGGFEENVTIKYNFNGANAICARDLDFDGDVDVLATAGEAGLLAKCKNDGTGNFPAGGYEIIDSGFSGANCVNMADLDADFDGDIVACAAGLDQVICLMNDGFGNFVNKQIIASHLGGPSSLSFFDLDSDGRLDILVTFQAANWVAWCKRYTSGSDVLWEIKNIDAGLNAPLSVVGISIDVRSLVVAGGDIGHLIQWKYP
jgi:PKD repeat protein